MKYEFVEFYPVVKAKMKNKKILGTCHIYAIDIKLDIRGILVLKHTKGIIYSFPKGYQFCPEEKKVVSFPLLRFTCEESHKELWKFMFDEVSPKIQKRLQNSNESKSANAI
jgi:hypothetical protein